MRTTASFAVSAAPAEAGAIVDADSTYMAKETGSTSIYLGIELLRLWGASSIVWIHLGSTQIPGMGFAVPCFMIISFFFSWKMIDSVDAVKLRQRLWRLAVPFFAWGFVSYIVALALGTSSGIAPLIWQLTLGHSTCAPLYFLFNVAVLMVVLFMLRKFMAFRIFWCVVTALLVVCLWAQYSGVNYCIWKSLPFEASYPIGRIFELFPHAVAGCALAALECRGWRAFVLGVILFGCGVLMNMCTPFRVSDQFGYAGLVNLLGASGLVLSATAWRGGKRSSFGVCSLSIATAGVYFIHPIVGSILNHFGLGCFSLVLIISFSITLLGLHVPLVCVLFNKRHPIAKKA